MVYDVVVIGAGVVGALTARELSRYHLKVLVLEAASDAAEGSTKANSAIVHGGFAEGPDTLKGRLGSAGRRLFPRLEEELGFGYREIGSLVLSFSHDTAPLRELFDRGLANGVTGLELWPGERVHEHEPNVNPEVKWGLWCSGAGICSPWELAYAALENAVAHGVEFLPRHRVSAVTGPLSGAARWRLDTNGGSFETRFVLNAAGLGAGEVDSLAGLNDSRIAPRTGQYLVFGEGTGTLVNSVLFQVPGPMGKGVLVAPTYAGNLLVGPDARNEEARSGCRDTTIDRLSELARQASRVVDGIDWKKTIRSFTGVRAALSGGDFFVGAADPARLPGWHRAAGIQSPGLTAAPALARLLVDGLAREGLGLVSRIGYDPRRPGSARLNRPARRTFPEIDAATRLPEGEPDRVVCRCEQVRERDLDAACSRGLPVTTADAVKRRTRAGMGWCQGRFCRPRVEEWLARNGTAGVEEDPPTRVMGKDLWSLLDPVSAKS